MTPQEAFERIKKHIEFLQSKKHFAFYIIEALKIAIVALKKQVPKKPDYWGDGYADGVLCYDYAKCPVCERDFEEGINDWGCKYCADCGQALDWSD